MLCRLASFTATLLLGTLPFVSHAPVAAQTSAAAQVASAADASAAMGRRIERARALAVVGQGVTAARELEAIRVATMNDPGNPARSVACVLLMGLYIEQADYRRAQNLLDEAFARRSAAANVNDGSTRTYYAIAGQLINNVRGRLERYRLFNIPLTGGSLPVEVAGDVEGMRTLLDALVQQSRTARGGTDSAALFEDALGLRLNLAGTTTERTALQRELADARQHLAAVEPRLQTNPPRAAAPSTAANNSEPNMNAAPVANPAPPTGGGSTANSSAVGNAANQPVVRSSGTSSPPRRDEIGRDASDRNADGTLLEVGSLVERATQRVPPTYPPSARSARVGGVVTVYLVVNEQGRVEEVRSAAGPQLLRRAAEEAARRWRFRPVTLEGQPVRATGHISFNFTL